MPSEPTQRDARDAERMARHKLRRCAECGGRGGFGQPGYDTNGEWGAEACEHCDGTGVDPDTLDAYRDAVAARVRAELLQSGTPVWVSTNLHDDVSLVWPGRPIGRRGYWENEMLERNIVSLSPPLVPPGTSVEARVVLVPGGGNG